MAAWQCGSVAAWRPACLLQRTLVNRLPTPRLPLPLPQGHGPAAPVQGNCRQHDRAQGGQPLPRRAFLCLSLPRAAQHSTTRVCKWCSNSRYSSHATDAQALPAFSLPAPPHPTAGAECEPEGGGGVGGAQPAPAGHQQSSGARLACDHKGGSLCRLGTAPAWAWLCWRGQPCSPSSHPHPDPIFLTSTSPFSLPPLPLPTHPHLAVLTAPVVAAWPDGRKRATYHDLKWNEPLGLLYAAGKDKLVDMFTLG